MWPKTRLPSTASMRLPVCRTRYCRTQVNADEKISASTIPTPTATRVLLVWCTTTLSITTWVNKGVTKPTSCKARDASSISRQMGR
jgi:hypothetical protein